MSDPVADRTARADSDTTETGNGAGAETGTGAGAETERSETTATATTSSDDTDSTPDGSVSITRKPTLVSSLAAVGAVIVAVLAAALGSSTGLAFGAVGAVVLGAGLAVGNRTAIDVGSVVLFFGVVAGGLGATAVGPTVVGTIATVLAWDVAHTAIDVGEQLGREAPTLRLEAVAIVSSLLVGLVAGTIGYAVYVVGAGEQPVAALVLLLLAAALITVGLGTRRRRSGTRRSRHTERSRRE